MSAIKQGLGSEILAERHEVATRSPNWDAINDILIVEDDSIDGNRLVGTLRVVFGREVNVRWAKTLTAAVDEVLAGIPDIVFLDDILKPDDTAAETIPYLRRAGYDGHIIVISGEVTRKRLNELVRLGATTAVHKDDLDSAAVRAALLKTVANPPTQAQ
ncbi:MAG: response regulator [Pseudomonadota bacterium]